MFLHYANEQLPFEKDFLDFCNYEYVLLRPDLSPYLGFNNVIISLQWCLQDARKILGQIQKLKNETAGRKLIEMNFHGVVHCACQRAENCQNWRSSVSFAEILLNDDLRDF